MSGSVELYLFCKRHGKFINSHSSGFKRSIKMIETGKHSAFRATICNKDYTMRRVFLSTILRANGIFFGVNISH